MALSHSSPSKQSLRRPRWHLIVYPLLLLTVMLGLIWFFEIQTPVPWHSELERYLDRQQAGGEALTLVSATRADHPEQMHSHSGLQLADQSVYYRIDAVAADEVVGSDGRRPLPYPPTAIQCIQLQDERGGRHVVLIARHADLYNADWLLYEARGDLSHIVQTLAKIGCEL